MEHKSRSRTVCPVRRALLRLICFLHNHFNHQFDCNKKGRKKIYNVIEKRRKGDKIKICLQKKEEQDEKIFKMYQLFINAVAFDFGVSIECEC